MRYAIISDIHANLQAWKAVYEDIQNNNADRIICLGDIIGYGPNPAQILREVREKVDAVILGNHDAALCGKLDASLFNDDARLLLDWTRKQLNENDIKYISSLPLTLIGDGFLCAHGEFAEPGNFDYVTSPEEVMPSWKTNQADLLFVGHTHEPAIYVLGSSGTPRSVDPQDFTIDPGRRYFVNVGSVGQPRDKDPRACYCIYDTESRSVYWRRVSFEVEAYRKSLKATGLKLDPSYYLPDAKSKAAAAATPAEKKIVFSPPKSPSQAAHDVVAVQDLKTIPKLKKKIPLSMISLFLFIAVVVGMLVWQKIPHSATINGASATPLPASSRSSIRLPERAITSGNPIPNWDIYLEHKQNQQVGINLDPFKQPFLYLASKKANKQILLNSSWVAAKDGEKWSFEASFQKKKGFTGDVALMIMLQKNDGTTVSNFVPVKIPAPQISGLSKIQEQFFIPDGGSKIRISLNGNFSGKILILQPKLFNAPPPEAMPTLAPVSAPPEPAPVGEPEEAPARNADWAQ